MLESIPIWIDIAITPTWIDFHLAYPFESKIGIPPTWMDSYLTPTWIILIPVWNRSYFIRTS